MPSLHARGPDNHFRMRPTCYILPVYLAKHRMTWMVDLSVGSLVVMYATPVFESFEAALLLAAARPLSGVVGDFTLCPTDLRVLAVQNLIPPRPTSPS
jgi:hypothetical protein